VPFYTGLDKLPRTAPKSDIGYLIQAESNAYWIGDDEYAAENKWDYGCDYRVLYKFGKPIALSELRRDPFFKDWSAYRRSFQGRAFEIPLQYWQKLNQMSAERERGYSAQVVKAEQEPIPREIAREEELEEALAHDLGRLRKFGFDLVLYTHPVTGKSGRQFVCVGQSVGQGGRIDLLCYDRMNTRYVVIELKNVPAGQRNREQIMFYMGWVAEHIAMGMPVVGLVISRGGDSKFKTSLKGMEGKVFHIDLDQLGFK
jgi:hypothetical protein